MGSVNVNYTPVCNICSSISELGSGFSENYHINQIVNALTQKELHVSMNIPTTNLSYPSSGDCNIDIVTKEYNGSKKRVVTFIDDNGDVYTRVYKYIWDDFSNLRIGKIYSQFITYTAHTDLSIGTYYFHTSLGYCSFTISEIITTGNIVNFTVYYNSDTFTVNVYNNGSVIQTHTGYKTDTVPSGTYIPYTSIFTRQFGCVDSTEGYNDTDITLLTNHVYPRTSSDTLSDDVLNYASCTYGNSISIIDIITLIRYMYSDTLNYVTDEDIKDLCALSTTNNPVIEDIFSLIRNIGSNISIYAKLCRCFPTVYTVTGSILAAGNYYVSISPQYGYFTTTENLPIDSVLTIFSNGSNNYVSINNGETTVNIPLTLTDEIPNAALLEPESMPLYKMAGTIVDKLYHWIPVSDWNIVTYSNVTDDNLYLYHSDDPNYCAGVSSTEHNSTLPDTGISGTITGLSLERKIKYITEKEIVLDSFNRLCLYIPSSVDRNDTFLRFNAGIRYSTDSGDTYTTIANYTSGYRGYSYYETANNISVTKIGIPITIQARTVIPKHSLVEIIITVNKPSSLENTDIVFTMYCKNGSFTSIIMMDRGNTYSTASDIPYDNTLMNYNASNVQEAIDHLLGGGGYSLPTATTDTLGGVKVDGSTITILNGVISSTSGFSGDASDVDYDGTSSGLSATNVQSAIDELNTEKAGTSAATTSNDGLMSSTDKSKLDGIDNGANNYSLPTATTDTLGGVKVDGSTITILNGVISSTSGFSGDASDVDYNGTSSGLSATNVQSAIDELNTEKAGTTTATTSSDGLMSSTDKSKLDGIESGAEVNVQSDWNQTDNTANDFIKNKPDIYNLGIVIDLGEISDSKTYNTTESANFITQLNTAYDVSGNLIIPVYALSTKTTGSVIDNNVASCTIDRNVNGTTFNGFHITFTTVNSASVDSYTLYILESGSTLSKIVDTTTPIASEIGYDGTSSGLSATNVQSAIDELNTEKAGTSAATTSSDGLMSSTDKSKLDGIESGANNYTLPNATTDTLGGVMVDGTTITSTNGVISSVPETATNTSYSNTSSGLSADNVQSAIDELNTEKAGTSAATTSSDGLMSSTDKSKLDGIENNANNYSLPNATTDTLGGVKVDGTTITSTNGVISSVPETATNTSYSNTSSGLSATNVQSAIDELNTEKAGTSAATTSSDGLMSSTDKSKLDGIESGANNYNLPSATTSTLGGVMVDGTTITSTNGVISSVPETATNTSYSNTSSGLSATNVQSAIDELNTEKAGTSAATTSNDGLMSSTDKSKLDGIENNANNYSLPNATTDTLGGVKVDGTTITSNDGVISSVPETATNTSYSNTSSGLSADNVQSAIDELNTEKAGTTTATTSIDGLMSSTDKSKLDGIESGANNYTLPSATTSTLGGVMVDGTTITSNDGVISANVDQSWYDITDKPFNSIDTDTLSVTGGILSVVNNVWVGTTAQWEALDKTDIPDGIQVIITDD